MDSSPTVEERREQNYVGRRAVMRLDEFGERVPALVKEVAGWFAERGAEASGNWFIRYHVIDMPAQMDIEVAFPADAPPAFDGPISVGALPAGRYACLTYTGIENAIEANARLINWIGRQGEEVDRRRTEDGDAFAGRAETILTDQMAEPDQGKWQTQVAIKLRAVPTKEGGN